jgi:hypothetical protein
MFLKQPPLSSFKKLIVLTSRLVQGLRMMSLAKAVPEGIKDRECKRFTLQERPPVPFVPEKDPVQEMVSLLKSDQSLKTTIGADAELRQPIWHCGMHEAFLTHVSSALDVIKKRGTFKAYKEAHEAYLEQKEVAKQAKAALALFMASTSEGEKASEKASRKEPAKKSSEKEKAPEKTKEGSALAKAPAPELHNEYQALYDKATFVKETAKNKRKTAATEMFQFYANLLSWDAKYAWNKIVQEQTEANSFKDLQGVSRKGQRGLLCESFDECIMFHLLTVFPNSTAEQKSITFPTCSRSPRGLAYSSSYSA